MCGRKDGEIRRTVGWVPVPLCFVSLSLSPNSLSDLIPPCLPSAPKALTTSLLLLSPPIPSPTPPTPSLLVFSGGTAFNCVVEELKSFTTRVAHVLPVSDDGGSTAEIFRVLGGPAVGDIRSRCLRLADKSTSEAVAVHRLLGHRLALDSRQAKSEWYDIVAREHSLWTGASKFETIQGNHSSFSGLFSESNSGDQMNHFASVMAGLPCRKPSFPGSVT
ncbi:hypothetical protein ACFX1R_038456 [Malus domestica]